LASGVHCSRVNEPDRGADDTSGAAEAGVGTELTWTRDLALPLYSADIVHRRQWRSLT